MSSSSGTTVESGFGFLSEGLQPNGSSSNGCVYRSITYGNYTFTGIIKSSVNSQNVMNDDGITLKYIKHTLEVEFIITEELIKSVVPTIRGVDQELDYIREQLETPNQTLVFQDHGYGRRIVVKPYLDTVDTVDSNGVSQPNVNIELNQSYNIPNANFQGPYPEVLSWEPLANNKAVRCRWRVNFNLPKSYSADNQAITRYAVVDEIRRWTAVGNVWSSIMTAEKGFELSNYVLGVTEEIEHNVNEDGTAEVSLIGVIEFTSSGFTGKGQKSIDMVPRLIQALTLYFEPRHIPGFTRTQKYRYRKSKRELEYVITDKELPSDNPIFPRIMKYEATHEVSSSLFSTDFLEGQGFLTWNNDFSGVFTVAPGKWKGWAWIAMMNMVQQRMNRCQPLIGDVQKAKDQVDAALEQSNQDTGKVERAKITPKQLLHKIRIRENIHDRQVAIDLSYLVMSSLNTIFDNTGLFLPVHIAWDDKTYPDDYGKVPDDIRSANPKSYSDQWKKANQYLSYNQNPFAYKGPLLPGYNVIFDPYAAYGADKNAGAGNPKPANADTITDPEAGDFTSQTTTLPTSTSHIYAWYRRTQHYSNNEFNLDFPNPTTDEKGQVPAKKAPGLGPNKQSSIEYPGGKVGSDTYMSDYLRYADPSQTWIAYKPVFELIRDENSLILPSIESEYTASRKVANYTTGTLRNYQGFTINGRTQAYHSGASNEPDLDSYAYHTVQAFGLPVTQIRFRGIAVRVGYPIPTPVLLGCQNQNNQEGSGVQIPAYKTGKSYWKHYQVNQSADCPLFAAEWNILYTLQGDPTCANIGFNTTQPSEFV